MATKFAGTKSALYLQPASGGSALIALCGRQLSVTRERELVEVTTTTGDKVGHVTGLQRGTVTFNNLSLFLTDTDNGFSDVKVKEWFDAATYLFGQVLDDPAGTDFRVKEEFYCYMQSYTINRNNNEIANFDCTLVISEQLSINPQPAVCPVVTVTRHARRLELTFTGTNGLWYTFELGSYTSVTVTTIPWGAEFADLTPSTDYTIYVSVYDYTTGITTECTAITTSTLAILTHFGFGGTDFTEACSESTPITAYSEDELTIGVILYANATLTTIYSAFEFVKIDDVVYQLNITTGAIIAVVGSCSGPTVYSFPVYASASLVPCGNEIIYVFSYTEQFQPGMSLYTNPRMTVPVSGYNSIAPGVGANVAFPYSQTEIFAISGAVVGESFGTIC